MDSASIVQIVDERTPLHLNLCLCHSKRREPVFLILGIVKLLGNAKFKLAVLHLKIDLVSYTECDRVAE